MNAALTQDAFSEGLPWDLFAFLRREQPVSQGELPDGSPTWNIVRYEDVVYALKASNVFWVPGTDSDVQQSNGDTPGVRCPYSEVKAMMTLNPPHHEGFRKQFLPIMRPARVEAFRPIVRRLAEEAASEVRGTEMVDAVADFAAPLATNIVCAYLGVADENRGYFRRLSAAFMGDGLPSPEVGARSGLRLSPAALNVLCGSPARSALTLIRDSWEPREWLDDRFVLSAGRWEFEDIALQSFTAGVAGLRNCIVAAVQNLADFYERIEEEPECWLGNLQTVAREIVRLASPLLRVRRVLAEDTTLRNVDLRAGETVLLWLVSANTDPDRFADPLLFKPFRSPNPHLSFSLGSHHCLGASLVLMELEECVRAMIMAWSQLHVLGTPIRFASSVVNEFLSMPIRVR